MQNKFKNDNTNTDYGTIFRCITLRYVDNNTNTYNAFLKRCINLPYQEQEDSSIFFSPQFLVNHPKAADVFVGTAVSRTLRLICNNEVYLHVQHGMTFREDIRSLRDDFLHRVFRGTFAPPRFLATTATLPVEYVRDISFLTTVPIHDDAVIRGDRESMAQKLNIFQTGPIQ